MLTKINRKRREDLVAFIRDTADKSILNDFPSSYHAFLGEMIHKMIDEPETRIVISQARQMGKTSFNQMFIEKFLEETEKPIYIKKFYLRSGTFEFRLYSEPRRWELVKITKPNKWGATSIDYILKFLVRRGAKQEDILEVEQQLLEVLS